jgi:DNA modification methylase
MKTLEPKSVDLLICDLPYGETNCGWDIKIDMTEFWKEFKRIRKSKRTACIHFCSTRFGYELIKSWEKGFKMDMVWKKRNKVGGLQSRYRPMRNHEMVYFFYEQSPKYNRDKYHKRIKTVPKFEKEQESVYGQNKKENTQGTKSFEPPNPASVIEEDKTVYGVTKSKCRASATAHFEPPNPSSVLEENEIQKKQGRKKYKNTTMGDIYLKKEVGAVFEPPNPASVVEEPTDIYGETRSQRLARGKSFGHDFQPPNPASVLEEEFIEPAEDEPLSMFESTKVFIGKRNHQTEKPQDILEFFLKYWSDEDDVILDPTMGSGSTGVACKKMNRKFIGFELNPDIFQTAQKRISSIP